ncbi:hypothetical protein KEJ25_05700 [Candidatus Bathyarchaeota archaeon]|nr:hypothetical protein [Candidatus Bathyarchaeota archaeon]
MTVGTQSSNKIDASINNVSVPPLGKVGKNSRGTATQSNAIMITHDNGIYAKVKVALIDFGGLYGSMRSFNVVIWNGTTTKYVWAVLTLEEPVATFTIGLTGGSTNLNMTVSWVSGPKVADTINYGVAAEVIEVYPP